MLVLGMSMFGTQSLLSHLPCKYGDYPSPITHKARITQGDAWENEISRKDRGTEERAAKPPWLQEEELIDPLSGSRNLLVSPLLRS